MNNVHTSRRHFMVTVLGCGAVTSSRAEEPAVTTPAYNRMTDEDEIKLGREGAEGIDKEKNLKFVENPKIHTYVNELFQKIAKSSKRPNLPYSIKIVDTQEINAFALPGGFIYVNRGLLEMVRSESELAGVLGHEVAHVAARHGANKVARMTAAESLVSEASRLLLGSDSPGKLLMQIGGPLALLALLRYTRTQELEADLLGFYNVQRAGWHPQGMVDLFQHLGSKSTPGDSALALVSSHPAPSDREAQVASELRRFPPAASLVKDSEAFKSAQAEIRKLPAAKVKEKLQSE